MEGRVISVARNGAHRFSKEVVEAIIILEGLGVVGDAHAGITVKHRSRVKADPTQPNLRQVHLIHAELFDEVAAKGFSVAPADLGENITTQGIDLLALPRGTVLAVGESVRLEVTGLRNPCAQIEAFQPGLLSAVLDKAADGTLIRKSGIMSIVLAGGMVQAGDAIRVELPAPPFLPLERV
ncbi:MOSC domain-containing protein [Erythromicrobium ramosum]|uniref:MOSC domain-containing protein n=1 Tax=Erythrobacter ramosus TaxID=35811 RepID=A0A6I4UL50_9SPHN|nr:MOSC domain-containing protein [Erythrobacter ramosus]MXP39338.1 MOSC domain-containing protein [Erythrobacter ramosus]